MGWSLEKGDREETYGHRCGRDIGHKGEKGDEQSGVVRSSESDVRKTWLYTLALPLTG